VSPIEDMDKLSGGAPPAGRPPRSAAAVLVAVLLKVVLPLVILAAGGLAAAWLVATGPQAARKPPDRRVTLVDVEAAVLARHPAVVHVMGTVTPARVIDLQPRVSGEVMEVAPEFLPGGRFRAGETLLQIDREDYELAVERYSLAIEQAELAVRQSDLALEKRQSDVARTESSLKLELGQQAVAQREFELLGETVSETERELVLRQPQLRTAQAEQAAARAAMDEAEVARQAARTATRDARNALQRARLDLERTAIRAPFNAVVRSRHVDLGATVAPATRLATLVGTDEYWVEVSVPVDQLKWIRIPQTSAQEGAAVKVYDEAAWGAGVWRDGRVRRLTSDVEEQGRTARLLVTIRDPLALEAGNQGRPPVLIGSYVRAEIEGTPVESAAAVRRDWLHDGDRVWVMNAEDRLEFRPVTVVFRSRDLVLVAGGLRDGERIVTTDLPAPVEGMPLRAEAAGPEPAGGTPAASGAAGGKPAASGAAGGASSAGAGAEAKPQ